MKNAKLLHHGHRFPAVVISCAVRWYFRLQLSLRDIEELLFERGMIVSYETIRRWCDKFGSSFAYSVKAARRGFGRVWSTKSLVAFDSATRATQCGWNCRPVSIKDRPRQVRLNSAAAPSSGPFK